MKTRAQKQLAATEKLIEEKAEEADSILKNAEAEDRDPNEKEDERIKEITREVKNLREKRDEIASMVATEEEIREFSKSPNIESIEDVQVGETRAQSLGEQFVESKGYRDLLENGFTGNWKTGQIDLSTKATLLSTPGSIVSPPTYLPGIVEDLFQPPTVADLMPSAQTTSPVIKYVEEGSITNAAAATDEGAAKPESTLALAEVTENVRKIATFLPVTDEMLEDAAQIQSYINGRLSLFIKLEEDDQLLNGNGTAPNISGFLDRAINTYAAGTVDDNAVAIFKAANGTRGSSFLSPDAIVMNPANWQVTRLLTDTNDQFYGGGPFYGPYGGPQGPASANRFSADNIWGLNVIVTSAIGAGTALLGSFRQAAQVFRRSGLTVEASNSHDDFFQKNLTAIRAEERLALAVYRPGAFTQVTGLD